SIVDLNVNPANTWIDNETTVALSSGGQFTVKNTSSTSANVVVDVEGYVMSTAAAATTAAASTTACPAGCVTTYNYSDGSTTANSSGQVEPAGLLTSTSAGGNGSVYAPVTPVQVLNATANAGSTTNLALTGRYGVPASASAVALLVKG